MNKSVIKYRTQIFDKNTKKFIGILRSLAKSDSSLNNKMKVTVCKEDKTEEIKHITIAPLIDTTFSDNHKNLFEKNNSTENTNNNTIEDIIKEKEVQSPQYPELKDYPDSSDFGDDDE